MSDGGQRAHKRPLSPPQGGGGPESGRAVRQKSCADAGLAQDASAAHTCLFCLSSAEEEGVKLCECRCACRGLFCCVRCLYKTGIGTLELKKTGGSLVRCTMCKENFCDDTIREIVEYSMHTVEALPRGDQARLDREFLNLGTLMLMKDPQASRQLIHTLAAQYTECLGPEHASTVLLEFKLGLWHLRQADFFEAMRTFVSVDAKQIALNAPGQVDWLLDLLNTRGMLAVALSRLGMDSTGTVKRDYMDVAESTLGHVVRRLASLLSEADPRFVIHQSNFSTVLSLRHNTLRTRMQRERFEIATTTTQCTFRLQRLLYGASDQRTKNTGARLSSMRARLVAAKAAASLS
jgi:hypothetical protein